MKWEGRWWFRYSHKFLRPAALTADYHSYFCRKWETQKQANNRVEEELGGVVKRLKLTKRGERK